MVRRKRKPQIVVEDGEPTAVILDIGEYEQLLERLEEAEDLEALQEMRKKPLKFRPLSEFLDEHKPAVEVTARTSRGERLATVSC
ncbi:MAG: type II toxin-antitoxin system prevent-host-death family antitoxin [Planctomycetota bacterium]|nr:type II toxin-antitoxin system prevent-host-death family antitoxin [Planctomycetota bacterium]